MKTLYLTFDDGPNAGTDTVLNILAHHNIKATFYLNGKNMGGNMTRQYRLVRRMIKENHAIANHGFDHHPSRESEYSKSSPPKALQDFYDNIEWFEKVFKKNGGKFPGFHSARLPGHGKALPNYVKTITKNLKVPHVSWNFEFSTNGKLGHLKEKDWQGLKVGDKVKAYGKGIAAELKRLPIANEIVLLHDEHWTGAAGRRLFIMLIIFLKKRYVFKTLKRKNIPNGHSKVTLP